MQIFIFKIGASNHYGYAVWYNFFSIPLLGTTLFVILSHISYPRVLHTLLATLSDCAFGVYLLHELLLLPLLRQFGDISDKSGFVLVGTCMIYIACVLLVLLFGLLPIGRKLFLRKSKSRKTDAQNA